MSWEVLVIQGESQAEQIQASDLRKCLKQALRRGRKRRKMKLRKRRSTNSVSGTVGDPRNHLPTHDTDKRPPKSTSFLLKTATWRTVEDSRVLHLAAGSRRERGWGRGSGTPAGRRKEAVLSTGSTRAAYRGCCCSAHGCGGRHRCR